MSHLRVTFNRSPLTGYSVPFSVRSARTHPSVLVVVVASPPLSSPLNSFLIFCFVSVSLSRFFPLISNIFFFCVFSAHFSSSPRFNYAVGMWGKWHIIFLAKRNNAQWDVHRHTTRKYRIKWEEKKKQHPWNWTVTVAVDLQQQCNKQRANQLWLWSDGSGRQQ